MDITSFYIQLVYYNQLSQFTQYLKIFKSTHFANKSPMTQNTPRKLELSDAMMKSFKPAKIIKQSMKQIVAVDFSDDGTLLYVADSTCLYAYATRTGQNYKRLFLQIHQIQQLSHTHNNSTVLVATKKNNLILYWSIHQNKIIKIFKGHTDGISSLLICPKNDLFLTTSHDNTMRLWDLDQGTENYKLNVESESMSAFPVANFDPSGIVFGAAWSQQQKDQQIVRICLYDIDKCQSGPFADWQKKDYNQVKMMKFSNCGDHIILATSDNSIIVLDAFEGIQQSRITNFANQSSIIECSFTSDPKYILSGSENGLVHVWNINGKDVVQLKSHVEKVSCVKFSPNMCLMVSAGRNIVFWLPQQGKA